MIRGSSPLSRGIRGTSLDEQAVRGIIPALAGNTAAARRSCTKWRDHPRSRGEYAAMTLGIYTHLGSSPLSRGIPLTRIRRSNSPRIIPALAGNTSGSRRCRRVRQDHPRSRGEYTGGDKIDVCDEGSSPLSRGIQDRVEVVEHHGRIIPALAGNTLVDKGFYQPDLSDLGNPLLARLRFSKSLAPRLRRPPSWRGGSSGSASEGPGRTIRVSPS